MYRDYGYCNKHGHDWALKDCNRFMARICLRCGAKQFFFPEEADYEPSVDDNGTKIDRT